MTRYKYTLGDQGPFYVDTDKVSALDGVTPQHPLVMEQDGTEDNQAVRRSQLLSSGGGYALKLAEQAHPAQKANTGWLYAQDVAGTTELWYRDDAHSGGNYIQLTSGGHLNATAVDHGGLDGLGDDDHVQYHNDARGDARYYTEAELDAGQLDSRYFTEAEHLNISAGAGDAGKPIKLDAGGHIDATMLNTADVDHGSIGGLGDQADHTWALTVDGSRALTAPWDIGAGQRIEAEEIRARTNTLSLTDSIGAKGLRVTSTTGQLDILNGLGGYSAYFNCVTGDFHTDGTLSVEGNVTLGNAAGDSLTVNAGTLDLSNSTKDVSLNAAVDALNFGSSLLTLDASNNRVGINTAAPSGTVESVQLANYNIFYQRTYSATSGHRSLLFQEKSHQNTVGNTTTVSGEYLGSCGFRGVDSGGNFDYGAYIAAIQDGAAGTSVPTNLVFLTYNSAGVNNNHLVLHNDNHVGIGTVSPTARLEIETVSAEGHEALHIDQNDADKAFIDFAGTYDNSGPVGAGNLTTVNGGGSLTGPKTGAPGWQWYGMIKIEMNGSPYWLAAYEHTP